MLPTAGGVQLVDILSNELEEYNYFNSSDGRQVVRAFALGAVDMGLIPCRVKPMTSLFDIQY